MKSTDIALIIMIVFVSGGVAFGLVSAIPGLKQPDTPVTVKTIDEYSPDIAEPNPVVFNKDAINPTVDVSIGGGSNSDQ